MNSGSYEQQSHTESLREIVAWLSTAKKELLDFQHGVNLHRKFLPMIGSLLPSEDSNLIKRCCRFRVWWRPRLSLAPLIPLKENDYLKRRFLYSGATNPGTNLSNICELVSTRVSSKRVSLIIGTNMPLHSANVGWYLSLDDKS